jgi:predicted nucleotidyltransferase
VSSRRRFDEIVILVYNQQTGTSCLIKGWKMQKIIINKVSSLKEQAKTKYNAEIKAVFGSVVTDSFKSTSDIDILVEFSKDADLFTFVGLSQFLEDNLKHKVDVVPMDSIREELKAQILRQAVYI